MLLVSIQVYLNYRKICFSWLPFSSDRNWHYLLRAFNQSNSACYEGNKTKYKIYIKKHRLVSNVTLLDRFHKIMEIQIDRLYVVFGTLSSDPEFNQGLQQLKIIEAGNISKI